MKTVTRGRKHSGRVLVLEGPDGSGKTTLVAALTAKLAARGVDCTPVAFPGNTPRTLGALVYDVHHGANERFTSLSPTSLQALHVAAHVDCIESTILPALARGSTVVLDRYWWSTWVYGLSAGAPIRSLLALKRLEQVHWGGVRPHSVFLLRRRTRVSAARAALEHSYAELSRREGRRYPVHVIDNNGAIGEVVDRMLERAELFQVAPKLSQVQVPLSLATPQRPSRPAAAAMVRLQRPKPTVVFETYWRFAAERQAIFERRLSGASAPWTLDKVLREHKFTNAYRASDRVSQFLIGRVVYGESSDTNEVFFRTVLFKFFNKIETWELLERELGSVSWAEFDAARYDDILSRAQRRGQSLYSGAYIMPTGGAEFKGGPKHRMHLSLLGRMMRDELPRRIYDAGSLQQVFEALRTYPTLGDFLAYQYAMDLNYGPMMNHSEMEFVMPGPGARDGIRKCFSDLGEFSESDVIRLAADEQRSHFERLGLEFRGLWGRELQLIDCQNLFCEVDKYSRVRHPEFSGRSGRTRIKQRFTPHREPLKVWYPPKWGLNERIASDQQGCSTP